MRKLMIWGLLCTLAIALASASAYALPAYAAATGKVCGYCHINPAGGGPLTVAGKYYFNNGTLPPDVPGAPTGLAATASSTTQIDLSWTSGSTNESGFQVEMSSSSTGPFTVVGLPAAGATTYSATSLTPATVYYFRVCAWNATGNSAYTNVATATTLGGTGTAPSAPTGLAALGSSASQIDLTWTVTSTNETGFTVQRAATSGGPFATIATLGPTVGAYSDTGLTAGTTFYYQVCAFNTSGSSAFSNIASATTTGGTITAPAAPTGLGATASTSSQIDLTWTSASTNESGFRVESAASATGPFTQIADLPTGTTAFSDTGLTASTTYYFRVYAYNAGGNSDYSNTASATTPAAGTGGGTGGGAGGGTGDGEGGDGSHSGSGGDGYHSGSGGGDNHGGTGDGYHTAVGDTYQGSDD